MLLGILMYPVEVFEGLMAGDEGVVDPVGEVVVDPIGESVVDPVCEGVVDEPASDVARVDVADEEPADCTDELGEPAAVDAALDDMEFCEPDIVGEPPEEAEVADPGCNVTETELSEEEVEEPDAGTETLAETANAELDPASGLSVVVEEGDTTSDEILEDETKLEVTESVEELETVNPDVETVKLLRLSGVMLALPLDTVEPDTGI
jgi:hypothetical protein